MWKRDQWLSHGMIQVHMFAVDEWMWANDMGDSGSSQLLNEDEWEHLVNATEDKLTVRACLRWNWCAIVEFVMSCLRLSSAYGHQRLWAKERSAWEGDT